MAKRVTGDALGQAGFPHGQGHGPLQRARMQVMSANLSAARIARQLPRGEQELPADLLSGAGILPIQGVGQAHTSHAAPQVAFMHVAPPSDLLFQGRPQGAAA